MTALVEMRPLASLVDSGNISYGIVQPGNNVEDGIPIVRVKDVRGGAIDTDDPFRVAQAISEIHSRTRLEGGEVLVSVVGTVGEAAVVPERLAGWNVARAIAVLRPRGVEAQWLKLCFELPESMAYIDGALNTTVQSTLNLADLKRLQIPLPSKQFRLSVLEVIGALDDKIAGNSSLIRLTDELSKNLFLGMMTGANSRSLTGVSEFINGKAFTKDATGTGRVVVRIAELNSGIGGSTVYNDIEVDDAYLARPGDLLFAWSGSLTLHRWYRDEAIVNQHIFKVVPKSGYPLWLINQLLAAKLEEFRAIAADKATTMGHIQRRHLDEPVPIPTREQIDRHDELMTSLWKLALNAERESLRLTEARDFLLPLLMSGRLHVKDAEEQVEAVV